jgi:hypothetical protein
MLYSRFRTLTLCCAMAAIMGRGPIATASPAKLQPSAIRQTEDSQRGIRWDTSLETAMARSRRTGKPLLLLHLFGKLNEEFC